VTKINLQITPTLYILRFDFDRKVVDWVKKHFEGRRWTGDHWEAPRNAQNAKFILANPTQFGNSNLEQIKADLEAPDYVITSQGTSAILRGPYNEDVVNQCRDNAGIWDKTNKVWIFAHLRIEEGIINENLNYLRMAIFDAGYSLQINGGEIIKGSDHPTKKAKPAPQAKAVNLDTYEYNEIEAAIAGKFDFLRKYQVIDVARLIDQKKALDANDMGLGKTLEALCAIAYLRAKNEAKKVLVLCPSSIKKQWSEEALKWVKIDAFVINGTPAKRTQIWEEALSLDEFLIITNYENLRTSDYALLENANFDIVIMDEATKVKNYKTKNYKKAQSIANRTVRVIELSGTPIESHISEIYTLMGLLNRGFFGSWYKFAEEFLEQDQWGGYHPQYDASKRLGEKLGTFAGFIRWKKTDVLNELPPINILSYPVEFNTAEMRAYKEIMERIQPLFVIDQATGETYQVGKGDRKSVV
jgi:SNF2 family DNA or RNA helicase